ncbi:MAG: thymidylate kinase [Oscillospiraceae bacterium]|nr:thymidylate kinase [Oscillospiraceae bacterium]
MGKLIVFEGTDGSGKSTQFRMLTERLQAAGRDFRRLQFPRYEEPSSALIRMYLGGAFGGAPEDVNAYAASLFYAVDRYASYAQDWGRYYRAGGLVLSDRYTTSNAVHQAAKAPPEARRAFLSWLSDLEYGKLGLPEPDLVILMHMPLAQCLELLRRRTDGGGAPPDIHEKDAAYLETCRRAALEAAAFYHWTVIDCAPGGVVRPAADIAAEIDTHIQCCLED